MVNLLGQGEDQKMIHGLRIVGASTASITEILLGQADLSYDAGSFPWDYCVSAQLLFERISLPSISIQLG